MQINCFIWIKPLFIMVIFPLMGGACRIAVRLGSCTSHSAPVQRGRGPAELLRRQVTIHQSYRGDRWEPSFHGPTLTSPRTKWLDTMRQPCSLTEGQRVERHSCQANGERTHMKVRQSQTDRRGRGGRLAGLVKKTFTVNCWQLCVVIVAHSHEW